MAQKTSIGFSIYLNGKLIREVTFDRPIVNVGKLSTSNLQLDDINVSRKHAVIEQRENGEWRVTDLGSTNGTVLRGERIVQADIHDGDRLMLGTTTLVVHLDEGRVAQKGDAPAPKAAEPAGPVVAEEIRGLGADSFYKKSQTEDSDRPNVLEVAMLWGETVLAVHTFPTPVVVSVGEEKGSRFFMPVEALGFEQFELIKPSGGKFALNLSNPRIEGDVLIGSDVKSLDELRESNLVTDELFVIDEPMRARLRAGDFTMLVSFGQHPAKPRVSPLGAVDYNPWIYIGISAIIHIAFLITVDLIPEDFLSSTRDPRAARERAMRVLRVEPLEEEEKEKEKEPEEEKDPKKFSKDGDDKMRVSESEIEVEQPVDREMKLVDKLTRKRNQEIKEWQDLSQSERESLAKEKAMSTGLNQAFVQQDDMFSALLNTNPDLMNKNKMFALGAQMSDDAQADFAAGAIDPFGGTLTPSGGGMATVGGPGGVGGVGGPAVAGMLGKDGRRAGLGNLKFNERPADPKIIQMKPRLTGELDPKTVQAYIRRYLSGIKWCYQDRLQQNRRLKGKLTLAFTILPNGRTHNPRTTNSTVRDATLEACIAKKMSRWKFPTPKDGGLVEVAYPLILRTQ